MYHYLRDEYIPATSEREAAGEERYKLLSRAFLGAKMDLQARRTSGDGTSCTASKKRCGRPASRIIPGGTFEQVNELLETTRAAPSRAKTTTASWLQELHDQALEELHGKHFDIPDSIRKVR